MTASAFLFLLLCLFLPASAAAQRDASGDAAQVLVLHSYHQGYAWTDSVQAGIAEGLSGDGADLYIYYMESKRHGRPECLEQIVSLLRQRYTGAHGISLDLVICTDDPALDFMLSRGREIFPGLPIVFCGANAFDAGRLRGVERIYGVNEEISLADTVDVIAQLRPDMEVLTVVADATQTGRRNAALFQALMRERTYGFEVDYQLELEPEVLLGALRRVDRKDAVLYLSYLRSPLGRIFSLDESIAMVVESSAAPVFGCWDFLLGSGAAGGKVVSGRQQGLEAAGLALQVLNGKSPASRVLQSPNVFAFDAAVLASHGIPLSAVPAGSRLIHQREHVWLRYLPWFVLALLVMSGEGFLIARLLIGQRLLKKAEARNAYQLGLISSLLDSMPDIVFFKDMEGRYLGCNREFCRHLGLEKEAIIGKRDYDLYTREEAEAFRQNDCWVLEHQAPLHLEEYFSYPDGGDILHQTLKAPLRGEDGALLGSLAISRNVARQRAAEAQLRLQERVLDQIQDGVTITDLEGRITYVNKTAAEQIGVAPDEVIGRFVYEVGGSPGEASREKQILKESLDQGYWRGELTGRLADGRTGEWDLRVSLIHDLAGTVVALCGIATDITERKEMEAALEQRLAQLSALLESMQRGVLMEDSERTIVYANQEMCRVFDLGAMEKVLGSRCSDVFANAGAILDDPQGFVDNMEQKVRVRQVTLNERIPIKDGRIFERTYAPIEQGARLLGHLWLYRDKTEELRAAEALRESYAQNRAILQALPDVLFGINRAGVFTHGYANDLTMLTMPPEKFVGKSCREVLPEALAEKVEKMIHRALESREMVTFEYRITISGEERLREARVVPVSQEEVLAVVRDVTEQRQAEAERERLSFAIEQADEIVVITDADASIQYVNPAFEKVTGYTREEALGQNPRILKSGELDQAFYEEMWQTLLSGTTWRGRLLNRRKDGQIYTEDAVISPVRDSAGQIVNYVAVKRDISQQLKMEEQFRQAQKMEAVGQLTGGVAHDFNNLLQVMNGATELALEDLGLEHPAAVSLRQVADAGERAARIVSQLLAFSRRQIMRPESLDLNAVVTDIMKMLARLIGEHVVLEWRPHKRSLYIMADRGMVEQALLNLVVNARDAMPDGGLLRLECSPASVDAAYCEAHSDARPGEYALLAVQDSGCGMDQATLEHVFEPFFSTKEVGKGTGLGLATVYGVIKQHDGMIEVESAPGTGTLFRLFWPRVEKPARPSEAAAVSTDSRGGNEMVLFAEDDDLVRGLGENILKRAGYRVHAVCNGVEAVDFFREHRGGIDLVLLDVLMPEMGGRKAYEQMKALAPEVKVLFASGYSEDALESRFLQEEGLSLLHKPFSYRALLEAVRQKLDEKAQPA